MTDIKYLQEKEISKLKTTFDDNLLTISKQLEFLQKSLRKREKSIGSTIKRKDKVRLLSYRFSTVITVITSQ